MGHFTGRVSEIRLGSGGHTEAFISCPSGAVPSAGQYVLASDPTDPNVTVGTPVFLIEKSEQGFWSSPLFHPSWAPGTTLHLVGPLGHGFDLPRNIQRLGVVVLGETVSHMRSLLHREASASSGITLFTDMSLPKLPAAVEVHPLAALRSSLDWPDFIALDVPSERLAELRDWLGLPHGIGLPCPGQVLITTAMPCTGMAQCGACAVPSRRGWKLACEDGPVFDLGVLNW